ncbi:flagellar motor switch protein FliM [Geoalkalibacter halelectricus]|uniref:Flagellar motor switch protein FliM n=1 Tax=Geoalkalibacter halelectricus TaxID=2847045 RepID=A0ABY5ZKB1_9BACT|nr:flagellar motor switch protein FliM [Geoalkalibacter halelectricus]MDO3378067.1 flagellar motor switch protein FliM [Geoalkalibacter halelectricus]UWZ78365.1 flagellar motor switch protein FliM [Geoalkalibacter halelectricus]
MERILSKEEIAELLSAVSEGEIDTEEFGEPIDVQERGGEPTRLDLLRLQDSGRWRFQNIDIILDAFARNYGMSLTNRLQASVSVKRNDLETVEFESFLNNLPKNGLIGIVRLDPLKAGGLLIFDDQLSFSLLELMLGGTTRSKFTIFERSMTAIEINVIKGIIADACPDLKKAFAPLESLDCSLVKVETNPRLVTIVPPDAAMLITRLTVRVDNLQGKLTLAIPHATLDPLREKLKESALGGAGRRETLWSRRLQEELGETEVTLCATLGKVSLRVREILNLEVGDIIDLGCEPHSALRIQVEERVKFEGTPGVKNGKKAVRISETY